ncbi:hypothetical protein LTR35_016014 [Friedmanniomyces endolithicus]|uniref:BTB domain-containing protein n=1 Tax=Friedmanniomyces endolithicus TaxID=329885 RepID=A0AAN6J1J7_9PEZI|nr:hypothetical protein LTR35_016014 [Friedmanniomyces endolithicus]KAK0273776.1 hypothetical protein LTS00_015708 [Friedmanniomyces endolithicus]KAK0308247.1 hypothetical protein LTR82_015581 [Friedmanniomyces endolithicus]KAK0976198.1 hypothetical protein LTR54_016617 [Friedmanniomyces endolithicus]
MNSSIREMGSLLREPKFWDLEIKCEGRSYYVHRLIDSGKVVMEQNMFDGLTLERMLLFMYQGDYTVSVLGVDAAGEAADSKFPPTHEDLAPATQVAKDHKSEASKKYVPPHSRPSHADKKSDPASTALVRTEESDPAATALVRIEERRTISLDSAVAHLQVYAIASMYEVPDLQDLAFKKFKEQLEAVRLETFAEVARLVYTNTAIEGDVLSSEVASVALERMDELMDSSVFVKALLSDPNLQVLAGSLIPAVLTRAKSKEVTMEEMELKISEQQIKLAGLEQDLCSAETRAQDYDTERELAAVAKFSAVERQLKRQLDCAKNENLVLKSNFAEQNKELQRAITEIDGLLQAKQSISLTETSPSVSESTVKSLVADRDAWREKYKKRDRALKGIMTTADKWTECRNVSCYEDLNVWLDWDDRTASEDRADTTEN